MKIQIILKKTDYLFPLSNKSSKWTSTHYNLRKIGLIIICIALCTKFIIFQQLKNQ